MVLTSGTSLALIISKTSKNPVVLTELETESEETLQEPSEINFAQLRNDYDANGLSAAEKYNNKRFYFYIDFTGISSEADIEGIIYDSDATQKTKFDTISHSGEAWLNRDNRIAWDWDMKSNEEDAKKFVTGQLYYVEGLLTINYNAGQYGFETQADVTDIKIVKTVEK